MRQSVVETLQLDLGLDEELEHCHFARRGENVVGGLAAVHMVVGVDQRIIALFAAQQLDGAVGNDLVGVHVQAGARAALDRVHDKGVVQLTCGDLAAGLHDGVRHLFVQQADLVVGDGGSFFDLGNGVYDLRMHGQAGDVKVLRGAQGLHAVVDVAGEGALADGVVFHTELLVCFHK